MILYTLLTSIILIIAFPAGWIVSLFGYTYIRRRLSLPSGLPQSGSRRIWIHAASVGEAGIAFSMAAEIKRKKPGAVIFVSTSTSTGLDRILSMNNTSDEPVVDSAFLAPFDHPLITGMFLRHVQPTSFILVETEIWPWLIQSVHSANVPITIINGKLSARTLRRYAAVRPVLKKIMGKISLICVQSRSYSRRYHVLGVPRERIEILGNVKFDSLPDSTDFDPAAIRNKLGIPSAAGVFTAGSTRPGEEEVIALAFTRIRKTNPGAVLICAPRHLKRISEVEAVFERSGLKYTKKSSGKQFDAAHHAVLILDTMGDLLEAFACADAAFVGGSLRDFGGHNPMEPAALGVPVLFGPYMEQTGSKELLAGGAAALVHDYEELAEAVKRLFSGGENYHRMKEAGPEVVKRFKGTLTRTFNLMENRGLI